MTEELVTLETFKMLEEKGFNEYHYPTKSIAQRWLRETKNLHITIYNSASGYTYDISKADMGTVLYCSPEGPNDGGNWDTYEEALEAGILKCLKLI